MAIYYQHIGEAMTARDFPRSLGTVADGLRRFGFEDIEMFLHQLMPLELADIREKVRDLAPTGFQVWGIPSGAQLVLDRMRTGDYLMLLENVHFPYCGQVIHRISEMCHDLSEHIWGESRFPIMVLLQGELIHYGWDEFLEDFSFAPNYHMRGNTMRLADDRVASSPFESEEKFISTILTTKGTNPLDQETDFRLFADGLASHLREVKDRNAQHRFRDGVFDRYGAACAVCGFAIPIALDAAHLVPKSAEGTDDPRNGLPLCAVHHRLFDANAFCVHPETLAVVLRDGYSRERLATKRENLDHLPETPHTEALSWRWERFDREDQ